MKTLNKICLAAALLIIFAVCAAVTANAATNSEIDARLEQLVDFGVWLEGLKTAEPVPEATPEPDPIPDSEPGIPPEPSPEPEPDPTNWTWVEIPNSAMDMVKKPGVDDMVLPEKPGSYHGWSAIQKAWSGGVVVGDKLYITGGGHGDGANNAILAVDKHGKWTRVQEPSVYWAAEDCPGGVCPSVNGDCRYLYCTTMPDGKPGAIHSYQLLAADGTFLYRSGGGVYKAGKAGDGPKNWKMRLSTGEWSTFAESGKEKAVGMLIHVNGKLYQSTGNGYAVYDIGADSWEPRKGANSAAAQSVLIYVKTQDRFYLLGNNLARWVDRADYGTTWHDIPNPPAIIEQTYLGVVEHDGKLLLWDGGQSLTTLDTATLAWGQIAAQGANPGDALFRGTLGRFAVVDGSIVLVNGVDKNMFVLVPPGDPMPDITPAPDNAQVTPEPTPIPVEPEPSEPYIPPATTLLARPYWDTPPGDTLVEQACGPLSEWSVFDVHSDADLDALYRFASKNDRVIARIHEQPSIYAGVKVKNFKRCLKVVGVGRPTVASVNAATGVDGFEPGGVIIENLDISHEKYMAQSGVAHSGDCINPAQTRQFTIIRNVDVVGCQHHALIVNGNMNHYLEIGSSHFAQAQSHLVYGDQIAMLYAYDSQFESPGWGHALRCIALRCVFENVAASNIQLDGTQLPDGGFKGGLNDKQTYLGMHPVDIYTCGGNHKIDGLHVVAKDKWGIGLRAKHHINTCNVRGVKGGQWEMMAYGSDAWLNNDWSTTPDIDWTISNYTLECVGDNCYDIDLDSSYPRMNKSQKEVLKTWLQDNKFPDMQTMQANIPDPLWAYAAHHNSNPSNDFLDGASQSAIPLPVPDGYMERAVVYSDRTLTTRPEREHMFCWQTRADPFECSWYLPVAKQIVVAE